MSSTTYNDVINVKPNWGWCVWILMICLFVRKIYTWKVSTRPQYTFSVWKCMIRLRICAHCSLYHIRWFDINMTSMWHDFIFICFIYVMLFFTRPSAWAFWLWYVSFLKYLSRQKSFDECILLAKIQHSQPHMTLYRAYVCFNCGDNSECNVE